MQPPVARLTRVLLMFIAAAAHSATCSAETPEDTQTRHRKVAERKSKVHIICHRGASEFAHENTLEAYRATFELGADGNEIDIRQTKDGVLVCFHDDMLDRILVAYGDTTDVTWDELRLFGFRSPGQFGELCRIPTLEEVLQLHRDFAGLLHLDIKRPGLDVAIGRLLDEFDLWDHVAYCNQDNGGTLLKDPRLKLARYKAGLYLDHGEVFPDVIAAALAKPGDGLIVDDPRGALVALGRRLGRPSQFPATTGGPVIDPEPQRLPRESDLLARLKDDADWNHSAESDDARRESAQKILSRARAADQLGRLRDVSPEALQALTDRVERRSLHRDWMVHGLDGALALRALIQHRAPQAVETARRVLWRDDPALEPVVNPQFKNPRAWTDFRVKMLVFPALAEYPGDETEKLCRDYLALSDQEARRLGPDQFEAAGRTLLAVSPRQETAAFLMRHRLQVVRGRAILDCLARPSDAWARAALQSHAPHAIQYFVDDRTKIEPRMLHLRQHGDREWSTFPAEPDARQLEARFDARQNAAEVTLQLHQWDVKQAWRVLLNGKPLGELVRDESWMTAYLPIAAGLLVDGQNTLRIESTASGPGTADDIRVGELLLNPRPLRDVLGESTIEIAVVDADSNQPLPARLTILNDRDGWQTTDAVSNDNQAVRPGVIYTKDGRARFGVPAGMYAIVAGRGFEYSADTAHVLVPVGGRVRRTLKIRREVPTPGYVACDTHIHTRTFSGHGDATIAERMLTLAGEGIELPVATDHNVHIDYELHARQSGVRQYFTPVAGNEVTTPAGHFNIFPVATGARVPDYRSKQWPDTFREIFATPGVRVAVLNHARDLHSGVRPFGPDRFQAAVGEQLEGWPLRFNAMEVINSGATQTDPLQLARDWMTLLNCGQPVTPVGSSDSHDVSRFIVGQGRTYVRCDDRDVANLDVGLAVDNFLAGRVLVSYGLLAELIVDDKYRSGDTATAVGDELSITVRVLGPHWTAVSRVQLYANGQLVRDEMVKDDSPHDRTPGIRWVQQWKLPRPRHDVHLVAIATGPGTSLGGAWPLAKPYQPTSPDWQPSIMGISGAVWIDADGDGRRTSAREYAERAWGSSGSEPAKLLAALSNYDAPTASHAAHLWRASGRPLDADALIQAERAAPQPIRDGFRTYRETWRENERSRR